MRKSNLAAILLGGFVAGTIDIGAAALINIVSINVHARLSASAKFDVATWGVEQRVTETRTPPARTLSWVRWTDRKYDPFPGARC